MTRSLALMAGLAGAAGAAGLATLVRPSLARRAAAPAAMRRRPPMPCASPAMMLFALGLFLGGFVWHVRAAGGAA